MLSEDGSITKFITKIKKFPSVTRKKMSDIKWNYSDVVDDLVDVGLAMELEEEEKEEKYKQLEFEFDEDLVAPI